MELLIKRYHLIGNSLTGILFPAMLLVTFCFLFVMGNIVPFELLFFPFPAIEIVFIFRAMFVIIELCIGFCVLRFGIFHISFSERNKISYQSRECAFLLKKQYWLIG
jgi:hypothetical protein